MKLHDLLKIVEHSCNNVTTTLIQISHLLYIGFFSKTNHQAKKVQKYALNSQVQALQILTNDDEVENWSLSSFLLAVIILPHLASDFLYCDMTKVFGDSNSVVS